MFRNVLKIEPSSFVTEIVTSDYRTADVFRKHDIDFCCGGRWPLEMICQNKKLDTDSIVKELRNVVIQTSSHAALEFDSWDVDFLADYILNVHHRYANKALPEISE